MPRNRRFFYFLIIVSIIVALFYSILLGLIIFIVDIFYFFYLGRSTRKSMNPTTSGMTDEPEPPSVQNDVTTERDAVKIPCKYCEALVDPVRDKTCPNCGAPVDLT